MSVVKMDEFFLKAGNVSMRGDIEKLKSQNAVHENTEAQDYYKRLTEIFEFKTFKPIEKGHAVEEQFFHTLKLYFPDKHWKDVFEKYFQILRYQEENVHYVDPLMIFLSLIETGKMTIIKHRKSFKLTFNENLDKKTYVCMEGIVFEENKE